MKIKIAGGCGEHGRNCFYVQCSGFSFLVDCGLMAGEEGGGYPRLTKSEIEKLRFVFLTHSHADHSAALPWLFENGFTGMVIASECTLSELSFRPERSASLEFLNKKNCSGIDSLMFTYGRSGHCVGSVWYKFSCDGKTLLFSGDYTENTLVYAVDPIRQQKADFAVLDCALGMEQKLYSDYCGMLLNEIIKLRSEYKTLIFPVPKYGRGLEIYALMLSNINGISYGADRHFLKQIKNMREEAFWLKKKSLPMCGAIPENGELPDILFISDPQLKQPESKALADRILQSGGFTVMTGKEEKGSYSEKLLNSDKMIYLCYPVHQNFSCFTALTLCNDFGEAIAFHTPQIDTRREFVL